MKAENERDVKAENERGVKTENDRAVKAENERAVKAENENREGNYRMTNNAQKNKKKESAMSRQTSADEGEVQGTMEQVKKAKETVKESKREAKRKEKSEKQRYRRKRRKWPLVAAAVIVIGILAAMQGMKNTTQNTVNPVAVVNASRGDLQDSINTSGTVDTDQRKVIFAPVTGRIASARVSDGDAVQEGELLIAYDLSQQEKMLQQAKLQQTRTDAGYQGILANNQDSHAKLNEANVNLKVLNQQITDTESYLKELQDKLEKKQRQTGNQLAAEAYQLNIDQSRLQQELSQLDPMSEEYAAKAKQLQEVAAAISRNGFAQQVSGSGDDVASMQKEIAALQETLAGYQNYKAQMESQKTGSEAAVLDEYAKTQYQVDVELAELSSKEAQDALDVASGGVTADFAGIVSECNLAVAEGGVVSEGMQLMTLLSSEKVKVTIQASKNDIKKLALGQRAEIEICGNTYEGEVSRISRMATPTMSGIPMVDVDIHIVNPDEKIILGMDAKLEIFTDSVTDALMIPTEAINADKSGDFLYVVEDGIVVRRPVVCGIAMEEYTQILEGITETDEIVLYSLTGQPVEEGASVTVSPME